MAIQFAGFLLDAVGAAVEGATVNLYDRNTVTPSRANTTTSSTGAWSISHATEGKFDVALVNGTEVIRLKYDTRAQMDTVEVANLLVRNPADTFAYNILPAAIGAARTLTLPLLTGTGTMAVLENVISGGQTFAGAVTLSAATLVAPALGTPASGVMTNASGTAANLTAGAATILATTRAIGGVNFNGSAAIDLPGVNTAGSQDTSGTAALATTVTSSANNTEAANLFPTFVDAQTGAQGIETDVGLTYNPNTGLLTALGFAGAVTGAVTGNADTATSAATLTTARTIGGVSFNGSAAIDLPGVNTAGNQATSGLAASATILATTRAIGGVNFNGSAAIDLPGVNAAGSQNTSGTAAGLSAALAVASGGTNLTSYAVGDIVYASGTTALSKLTKGGAGTVLTMGGSNAPTWAAAAAGGVSVGLAIALG